MYSYYFLTNYDPEYRKKLWWKKHVTQLQMVSFSTSMKTRWRPALNICIFFQFQFFCLILFLCQVLFRADCTYPTWPIALFLPHNFVILYMFAKFYQRTYLTKKKKTWGASGVIARASEAEWTTFAKFVVIFVKWPDKSNRVTLLIVVTEQYFQSRLCILEMVSIYFQYWSRY